MDTVTTPAARRDFFICHAHEDKAAVARPLQQLLEARGHSVWLDETELTVGDSLRRCIDHGLANCRFGIVVLSPAFFAKEWPQYELDGLMERQTSEGVKVVLPVWHGVDHAAVATRSPSLANLVAATTEWGIGPVVDQLVRAFVATTAEPAPAPAAPRDAGPVPGQPLRFPLPDAARAQLLADRPDFWEYFLFADSLARGLRAHEAAWRDHQLRLVRPTGRSLGK
ncbi:MAG TPA: toll/interleukin-1 receptor domain-containing protein, partial [Acidimicrobiales bacterium]